MKSQDTYSEPRIIKSPGWTIMVSSPILTDDERARRMKRIEKAAAAVLISEYEVEKRNEKNSSRMRNPAVDRQ